MFVIIYKILVILMLVTQMLAIPRLAKPMLAILMVVVFMLAIPRLVKLHGCKFFEVYQNLVIVSPFLFIFNLVFIYHVKTHLWMIMMEYKILIV
jgi:hypothetical protein